MKQNDLIAMSIYLNDVSDYRINALVEREGKHYIIRSIVKVAYNPIRKQHYILCKVREFKGEFK